jgi:nucleoside-diphosphate-sugar epimerase
MRAFLVEANPTYVIHLAAYASLTASLGEMLTSNVEGTRNLIRAMPAGVKRTVYTSTQLVVTMGVDPGGGTLHAPYTDYGESKASMERAIRAEAPKAWVIVRPANIWGPHHPSFDKAIFKYIAQGVYMHPSGMPIIRSYGYVKNSAAQIIDLMLDPRADGGVFYISEVPIDSGLWVDTLSRALRGKPVRRVPRWFLKVLGKGGDLAKRLRLPVPIDSGRVLRMTTNYSVPTEPTLALVGPPPFLLDQAASETRDWLLEKWSNEQ